MNTTRKQKNAKKTEEGTRNRKVPGQGKSTTCQHMLDRGGRKYREKTKAGYLWFVEYEGDKFYTTKAGDAYNVQNDPPEKC